MQADLKGENATAATVTGDHSIAVAVTAVMDGVEKIAAIAHRNGLIVGSVGGALAVLIIWGIITVNHDETSHMLCSYEFNRFAAALDADKANDARVAAMLNHSKCKGD